MGAAVLSLLISLSAWAGQPFMVILDAGHGGEDTGAIAKGKLFEKDITLALAREIGAQLRRRGLHVAYTRTDDRFVALDKRTEAANLAAAKADRAVFVSIHLNSNDDPRISGHELYVLNATSNEAAMRLADLENGLGRAQMDRSHGTLDLILSDLATTANYGESVALACAVDRALATKGRGVRQALFYVLMETRMPGLLFEAGFLTNEAEKARLLTPTYRTKLARSVVDGIVRWRNHKAVSGVRKSPRLPCPLH